MEKLRKTSKKLQILILVFILIFSINSKTHAGFRDFLGNTMKKVGNTFETAEMADQTLEGISKLPNAGRVLKGKAQKVGYEFGVQDANDILGNIPEEERVKKMAELKGICEEAGVSDEDECEGVKSKILANWYMDNINDFEGLTGYGMKQLKEIGGKILSNNVNEESKDIINALGGGENTKESFENMAGGNSRIEQLGEATEYFADDSTKLSEKSKEFLRGNGIDILDRAADMEELLPANIRKNIQFVKDVGFCVKPTEMKISVVPRDGTKYPLVGDKVPYNVSAKTDSKKITVMDFFGRAMKMKDAGFMQFKAEIIPGENVENYPDSEEEIAGSTPKNKAGPFVYKPPQFTSTGNYTLKVTAVDGCFRKVTKEYPIKVTTQEGTIVGEDGEIKDGIYDNEDNIFNDEKNNDYNKLERNSDPNDEMNGEKGGPSLGLDGLGGIFNFTEDEGKFVGSGKEGSLPIGEDDEIKGSGSYGSAIDAVGKLVNRQNEKNDNNQNKPDMNNNNNEDAVAKMRNSTESNMDDKASKYEDKLNDFDVNKAAENKKDGYEDKKKNYLKRKKTRSDIFNDKKEGITASINQIRQYNQNFGFNDLSSADIADKGMKANGFGLSNDLIDFVENYDLMSDSSIPDGFTTKVLEAIEKSENIRDLQTNEKMDFDTGLNNEYSISSSDEASSVVSDAINGISKQKQAFNKNDLESFYILRDQNVSDNVIEANALYNNGEKYLLAYIKIEPDKISVCGGKALSVKDYERYVNGDNATKEYYSKGSMLRRCTSMGTLENSEEFWEEAKEKATSEKRSIGKKTGDFLRNFHETLEDKMEN
ncbi:MAG: hypothetical protein ACQEQD_06705 [Bacillota bacterium]